MPPPPSKPEGALKLVGGALALRLASRDCVVRWLYPELPLQVLTSPPPAINPPASNLRTGDRAGEDRAEGEGVVRWYGVSCCTNATLPLTSGIW